MQTNSLLLTLASTTLLLLSACDSSTGGAAGDGNDDNADAVNLLSPFSGIYEINDNWRGQEGDIAYLDIQTPGADGVSTVEFHDFDETFNCLVTPASTGIARKDDFSDRIFMDELFQFDEAELTLSGNTLTIEFNDDLDLDADGSTQDRIILPAERVGVMQVSDLAADC